MEDVAQKILWDKIAYAGFHPAVLDQRREPWQKMAEELIELLRERNVVLVADTSVGKTVSALLAIIGGKYKRPLFLAPTKLLVGQHFKLLQKLLGIEPPGYVITGDINPSKRKWEEYVFPYIFATPQTVLNDARNGKLNLADFDLVVFDEIQDAQGDSDYLKLGKMCARHDCRILGLSPYLGTSKEKIDRLLQSFKIDETRRLIIKTPKKTESLVEAQMTPALTTIDALFEELLERVSEELNYHLHKIGYYVEPRDPLSKTGILELGERIQEFKKKSGFNYYDCVSTLARYFKLVHAHETVLAEGYRTFLKFAHDLRDSDPSKAAQIIVEDKTFQRIVQIAQDEKLNHPKVRQFVNVVLSLMRANVTFLGFVFQRNTAETLKRELKEAAKADPELKHVSIKKLFGGYGAKGRVRQQKVLDDLASGKVHGVLATSVIEKGVNLPEVGAVVHYSLPMNRIQQIQRSGRTGRVRAGSVIYICLDHELDKTRYFATKTRPRKIAPENISDLLNEKMRTPFTPKRRKKQKDKATLDLFAT